MDTIADGLAAAEIPRALVEELLDAFVEAKRRFYRGDLRPNEIEGGRFSEAVFRVLEFLSQGAFTPIGKSLPSVDVLLKQLENTSSTDSVRLHIPRALRLIYDIRNKRDAAHLADGIDPNFQDATLVIANMSWILAELVRAHHGMDANAAQKLIDDLVSKEVPAIQEFGSFPRVLKNLKAGDHCLVLLYWRGADGATFDELSEWVRPEMRTNLARTLSAIEEKHLVHVQDARLYLTRRGEVEVESRKLVEPD